VASQSIPVSTGFTISLVSKVAELISILLLDDFFLSTLLAFFPFPSVFCITRNIKNGDNTLLIDYDTFSENDFTVSLFSTSFKNAHINASFSKSFGASNLTAADNDE